MENTQKIEDNNADMATKPTESQIQDLIKNAIEKDYNGANKVFGEVMTIKLADIMDQEKIKMADQIYNGAEPEEEGGDEEEGEETADEENKDEAETEGETEEEAEAEAEDEAADDEIEDDEESEKEKLADDFEGAAV